MTIDWSQWHQMQLLKILIHNLLFPLRLNFFRYFPFYFQFITGIETLPEGMDLLVGTRIARQNKTGGDY